MHIRQLFVFLSLTFLTACGGPSNPDGGSALAPAEAPMAMEQAMQRGVAASAEAGATAEPQAGRRYLAERQFWLFEPADDRVEALWRTHLELCRQDCEVLEATLNKNLHAPVTASLSFRVGRARAAAVLAAMAGPEAVERRLEREDKTLEVVDLEARLKNLADLRDRLRQLLASRGGGLKDVLEMERELARVQGDLDAMTAQRRALANETEKVWVRAEYRPRPSFAETGAMQPLLDAWRGAGRAFAESLGAALLFVVQALPWLLIVFPALWGGWKLVRGGLSRLASWRGRVKG